MKFLQMTRLIIKNRKLMMTKLKKTIGEVLQYINSKQKLSKNQWFKNIWKMIFMYKTFYRK